MNIDAERQAFLNQVGSAAALIALFDLMPDVSFFLKDRAGRFMALNLRGCEYCGVKSEREAFGKTDRDFFPRRRAAEYIADDRNVMETGQPIVNRIEPAPENEASPHLVITNKLPVHDSRDHIIGVVGFSRSVEQVRCAPAAVKSLSAAIEHLHRHFATPISTSELARQAGLSISQFERTFRKAFGASPRQYLIRVRIEQSCRQLVETNHTIASISQECGFFDHAHFTRAFRTQMGQCPSNYRRQHQSPLPQIEEEAKSSR
jgi:AraC-like DNA-binding protein